MWVARCSRPEDVSRSLEHQEHEAGRSRYLPNRLQCGSEGRFQQKSQRSVARVFQYRSSYDTNVNGSSHEQAERMAGEPGAL
jgi:hypothetical protein